MSRVYVVCGYSVSSVEAYLGKCLYNIFMEDGENGLDRNIYISIYWKFISKVIFMYLC